MKKKKKRYQPAKPKHTPTHNINPLSIGQRSPDGKRAICVVATEPYNSIRVDRRGNPYSWSYVFLKPLLIQGTDGIWRDAIEYEIYCKRSRGFIWCSIDKSQTAGSLISVLIEPANTPYMGFVGVFPRVIQDDGFFEMFVFNVFSSQLRNKRRFRLPYVPKLPVYVMCLKDAKVCGPLRYEIQSFSPVTAYFTGQHVGCFEAKNVWCDVFTVTVSTSSSLPDDIPPEGVPPQGRWSACRREQRYTLCHVNFLQNSAAETINLESNEEFFRRINKEIPGIHGKPWISKLEDRIKKNAIVEKLRLTEKERYIEILASIIDQFDRESVIREELNEALTIAGIEKTVRELAQPQIEKMLNNAHQEAQAIVSEAEIKKAMLGEEIEKLENIKKELTNEVVFTEYVEKELKPALQRLEVMVDGVKPLLSLIPWLHRMTESNTPKPTTNVSREGESISDGEYFIEKRLLPVLQQFGIGVDKNTARRFHLTTVSCRCILVPDANWASAYAHAAGGEFLLFPIQPTNQNVVPNVSSPTFRNFWQQAYTQPDNLFL